MFLWTLQTLEFWGGYFLIWNGDVLVHFWLANTAASPGSWISSSRCGETERFKREERWVFFLLPFQGGAGLETWKKRRNSRNWISVWFAGCWKLRRGICSLFCMALVAERSWAVRACVRMVWVKREGFHRRAKRQPFWGWKDHNPTARRALQCPTVGGLFQRFFLLGGRGWTRWPQLDLLGAARRSPSPLCPKSCLCQWHRFWCSMHLRQDDKTHRSMAMPAPKNIILPHDVILVQIREFCVQLPMLSIRFQPKTEILAHSLAACVRGFNNKLLGASQSWIDIIRKLQSLG